MLEAGDPDGEVRTTWHAKEMVRSIYDHTDPDVALEFVTRLGLQDPAYPVEVNTLGRPLIRWRHHIAAWHQSRHTNAATEAANNLLKRVKRVAFGFTNFRHFRIRALLYAGRPNWNLLPLLTPAADSRRPRIIAAVIEPGATASDSWTELGRVLFRWMSPEGQPRWARTVLLVIAVVAGVLYGWQATGNLEIYYAAGVRSMSMSWHNFFFAALDPRGTVSLDKLPGAFWVQALSARLFGFSAGAIVAPQVAEGVLTVLVLYRAVRRLAGPVAAVTAAAVLALAPATVALNRGNISDTLMVLLIVLAADATVSAVLTGRARSAVLAGLWVGLAFQAKMLEAWLVLPALGLAYLLCSPPSVKRRIAHLAGMAGAAVAVSLSWMSLVSLLPTSGRPYVDGSPDDSLFHQVFVYNAFGRLHQDSPNQLLNQAIGIHIVLSGPGSWSRFLSGSYGRDTGWLIPAAAAILAIGLIARRRQPRGDLLRAGLVLWGTWLAVFLVALSADSSINSYYAAVFSPAVAGLIGTGVAVAVANRPPARVPAGGDPGHRRPGPEAVAIGGIVLFTVGFTAWLLPAQGTGLPGWLLPVTVAVGVVALALTLATPALERTAVFAPLVGLVAALVAMLVVPAAASVSIAANRLGPFDTPFESQAVDRGTRAFLDTIEPAAALLPTLEGAQFGAPDLMATQTSALASPFLYVSGLEVLPIGGYTGAIPSPTMAQLKSLIRTGQFHLVLLARNATDPRLVWITKNCRFVPSTVKTQFVAYFCGSTSASEPSGTATPPGSVSHADLVAAALRVQQILTEYPGFTLPLATLNELKANPADPAALAEARRVLGPGYLGDLFALTQAPQSVVLYLEKWGPIVAKAVADGELPKPEAGP
ncbi:MAG: glycosyltransferase family 39 protein [Acidimicrobiales bacterium]